jgi:hypothetical protein
MEVDVPRQAASRTQQRVSRVRLALRDIERQLGKLVARIGQLERRKGVGRGKPRRSLKLSPRRRAALKLQGAYMGFMRQLGPRQKNRVKAMKAGKGLPAAIALAKKLAAK